MFHSMVEASGAMYLLGGSNGLEKLNDAWVSTDGRREEHYCCTRKHESTPTIIKKV